MQGFEIWASKWAGEGARRNVSGRAVVLNSNEGTSERALAVAGNACAMTRERERGAASRVMREQRKMCDIK